MRLRQRYFKRARRVERVSVRFGVEQLGNNILPFEPAKKLWVSPSEVYKNAERREQRYNRQLRDVGLKAILIWR